MGSKNSEAPNIREEFFMPYSVQEGGEDQDNQENIAKEAQPGKGANTISEDSQQNLENLQKQAYSKQAKRIKIMGELLRSKGFIWLATSNTYIGGWQQAGNIHRVEVAGEWLEGNCSDTLDLKTVASNNTNEKDVQFLPFAGKRQELVFIGINLKHKDIQAALDQCLLNDDEMKMRVEKWDDFMEAEDKIQSALPVELLFRPEDIVYIKRVAD